DVAAGVEQWGAAIARIDGCVGLNPRAGTGVGKFANSADDAFGDAEEHGGTGIADGKNIFSLVDARGVGKREMREFAFSGNGRNFSERDIQVSVDVDDFGLQLPATRENCVQRFFASREMGVGGDGAG